MAFLMQVFGTPNFRRAGESAIVLDCEERDQATQQRLGTLARAARARPEVREAVVGASNLTLLFDRNQTTYDVLRDELERAWANARIEDAFSRTIEIPVRYGGDEGLDLQSVAQACGLDADEVIALHCGAEYVVGFVGFLPGFAYLDGLDPRLHLPRRTQPRTRVPAGSVAIARAQSAVYPFDSPGGWHVIGRTAQRMFDPDCEPAALLQPGDRVRFVAV
jgi:5-oxoprolinase (ATP-hydrolysing) subunit B